jgi:hypothetical protein
MLLAGHAHLLLIVYVSACVWDLDLYGLLLICIDLISFREGDYYFYLCFHVPVVGFSEFVMLVLFAHMGAIGRGLQAWGWQGSWYMAILEILDTLQVTVHVGMCLGGFRVCCGTPCC